VEQFAFSDRSLSFAELVGGQANRPPLAVDDVATVSEDTGVGINVLANDSDPDLADTLHLVSVDTTGVAGVVSAVPGGSVVYSAGPAGQHLNAGETMVEHFTYTVADQTGAQSVAGVTVTVTGVNDAPTVVDDLAQAGEDGPTTIHVLVNDSDVDTGDSLTVVSASASAGVVKVSPQGDLIYTPSATAQALNEGQTKAETLSYTVKDSHGATSTGSVAVLVRGVNDAPVALGDSVTVAKTGPSVLTTLLDNDADADQGDHLSLASVQATSAAGAAVSIDAQGHVAYDPGNLFQALGAGQTAADSFSYQVVDSHGAASTATVSLTITGAALPEDGLRLYTYAEEDGVTDNLYESVLDLAQFTLGEPVTLVSVDAAGTLGTVSLGDHSLVYAADDPELDALWGDDRLTTQFIFTVRTAGGQLHTGAVDILVEGINDDPIANPDTAAVEEGGVTANLWNILMANDTDLDGEQSHTISAIDTAGTVGHVIFDGAAHSLVYAADTAAIAALKPGESLVDHFGYTVRDSYGFVSSTSVAVTVTGTGVAFESAVHEPHVVGGVETSGGWAIF